MFRKALVAAACILPTAAHAEWHEASSRHFVVYSNDSEEHIRNFAERLERFDKGMRVMMGVPDKPVAAASRVTVYIVDDVGDVQALMGKGVGNVAGFYQPRTTGPVAFIPRNSGSGDSMYSLNAETILFHEYAHHFMWTSWGGAAFPMWFSEGFAEFNATVIFRKDGRVVFGSQPLYRAYGLLAGNYMPAKKMLQPYPGKMDNNQRAVLYSRAWLLTHYLIFDKTRAGQLPAYISAINSGKTAEQAMAIFGNPDTLDLKLNNYVNGPGVRTITLAADQVPPDKVEVRPLTPGETATMPARILSQNGVDAVRAPKVLAMARRLAAPFPNDPEAQNELAEAEFDAGNLVTSGAETHYAASEAASDRVLAVNPKSMHALLYKGMAQQALAEKAGVTDPAKWLPIRKWYLAANKVDPEYPEPLVRYYASFQAAKQTPTDNARNGLVYAAALAPFDLSLRMTAAKVLLAQKKTDEARTALQSIAFSLHGDGSEIAKAVLISLDSGGTAVALATFESEEAKAKQKAKDAEKKAGS